MNTQLLENLIGAKIVIETHEGAIQVGKLTKVNYIETDLLGSVVKSPKSIELNHDASEFADWPRIKSIKRYS